MIVSSLSHGYLQHHQNNNTHGADMLNASGEQSEHFASTSRAAIISIGPLCNEESSLPASSKYMFSL
jgi:hypothetical protein